MKVLKSIFQFIWSVYFLIGFFFMILIAFIVFKVQYFFFKTKYESRYKDFLFRGVGNAIRFTSFIRVNDIYHYQYDRNQSYVIVGNHNAALDIPLNTSSCPKEINMKFLGKVEAGNIPLLGVLIKNLTVLVDRKSNESRKNTFKLMAAEINKGYSIFLYPEGTRNRTNDLLKKFYDGAFRLALEHKLPIVVCTLVGTKNINSPHKMMTVMPGKVSAHWEEPIETKDLSKEDIPALKEKIKAIMIKRIEEGII